MTTKSGWPALIAIGLAVFLATVIGTIQGLVVSRSGLPSYLVTVAGAFLVSAVATLFYRNGSIPVDNETLWAISRGEMPPVLVWALAIGGTAAFGYGRLTGRELGGGRRDTERPRAVAIGQIVLVGMALLLFGAMSDGYENMPWSTAITLALLLLFSFVASRTTFGRSVYAIGRDREAASKAGIKIGRTRLLAFGLAGLMAGFAGFLTVTRIGASEGWVYLDLNLLVMVLTAAILGGTSVFGGRGNVMGILLGGLVVGLIMEGAAQLAYQGVVNPEMAMRFRSVLLGLAFALALGADAFFRRRRQRAGKA